MLHTLLLVLKIIGIILLAILALVVLLLCVVLFVSLRYRGNMIAEENFDDLFLEMKFSWLFPLISGYARYSKRTLDWNVRIAWKKMNQGAIDAEVEKEEPQEIMQEKTETERQDEQLKTDAPTELTEETVPEIDAVESDEDNKKASNSKREKKTKKKVSKIRYKFQELCDKIRKIKQTKDVVVTFLVDDIHQDVWRQLKRELIRILVYLKPKKIKGNLIFGFEDPYKTGVVLAVLSVLYPVYQENVNIYPDFEEQIIKGDLMIKGRIRIFFFVKVIVRLLLNRNVRKTYKDIKKLEL